MRAKKGATGHKHTGKGKFIVDNEHSEEDHQTDKAKQAQRAKPHSNKPAEMFKPSEESKQADVPKPADMSIPTKHAEMDKQTKVYKPMGEKKAPEITMPAQKPKFAELQNNPGLVNQEESHKRAMMSEPIASINTTETTKQAETVTWPIEKMKSDEITKPAQKPFEMSKQLDASKQIGASKPPARMLEVVGKPKEHTQRSKACGSCQPEHVSMPAQEFKHKDSKPLEVSKPTTLL